MNLHRVVSWLCWRLCMAVGSAEAAHKQRRLVPKALHAARASLKACWQLHPADAAQHHGPMALLLNGSRTSRWGTTSVPSTGHDT